MYRPFPIAWRILILGFWVTSFDLAAPFSSCPYQSILKSCVHCRSLSLKHGNLCWHIGGTLWLTVVAGICFIITSPLDCCGYWHPGHHTPSWYHLHPFSTQQPGGVFWVLFLMEIGLWCVVTTHFHHCNSHPNQFGIYFFIVFKTKTKFLQCPVLPLHYLILWPHGTPHSFWLFFLCLCWSCTSSNVLYFLLPQSVDSTVLSVSPSPLVNGH